MLDWLERRIGWLAIPGIGLLFITLQAIGFLLVSTDPIWVTRLALDPLAVKYAGEYWRLITFLALPLSLSPIWVLFVLWFLYFIFSAIEGQWGSFKTTFYVLISITVTVAFSLIFNYPVAQVAHFESTLFLAAASLFPEMEVQLFMIIPVKMKWLAWVSLAFLALEFARGAWIDRFYLIAIYSNCLVFFGPAMLYRIRQIWRRYDYKRKLRN